MNNAASGLFYFGEKAKVCVEDKLEFLPNLEDITPKELLKISDETKTAHGLFINQSTFKKEIKAKTKYRRSAQLQAGCTALQGDYTEAIKKS